MDIYLPSVEETMFMLQRDEFNYLNQHGKGHDILAALDLDKLPALGEKLLTLGAKIVIIKCGIKGWYTRTNSRAVLEQIGKAKPANLDDWADRELHEECFIVPKVASATGSGDSSIAGFLSAYLNGKSLEDCIRTACAVGAQNVQVFDAISGIKTWDETMAMIPTWPKRREPLTGAYWRYNEARQVRVGRQDRKP